MLRLDIRWGMAMALMVFALAVDARGQWLLETDGVELLGEAQLVRSGGGTCNVLESDTSYEEKKANHGAPMDIWRLDFSVRNGSGRWLDHLIARYQIESEWPDCTNWDGPEAGAFQPLEWAGSGGFIQRSGRNVVAPDQTLTQTKFFIVLRGDPEPRFANWSMDFDFAAAPPPPDSATAAPSSPSAATAAQETVFWQSIMNSTNPGEFEAYLAQFPNGVFRALTEARLAALRAPVGGSPTAGVAAGSDQPGTSRFNGEPTCAGQPEGAACWKELANQPECYIWNPNLQPDATVTWTGACSGGLSQGAGTLTWVWDSGQQTSESTGRLQEGERQGHWVERFPTGTVQEGSFVAGERHGRWIRRAANGHATEGSFVAGERHGEWVTRYTDGTVVVERWVNGEWVNN